MPRAVREKHKWADDLKANVITALLLGESQHECERLYGVPQRTISHWAEELGGIDALRQGRLCDLIYKFLTTNYETLEIQSRAFRDPAWLKEQSAAEIGTLFGIVADKSSRILAAMERARDDRPN